MSDESAHTRNFAWQELAGVLRGPLLLPGGAGYEERRRVWNGARSTSCSSRPCSR